MTDDDHKAINQLKIELAELKVTFTERWKWSQDFRKEMTGTLAEIKTKIEQFPCSSHIARMDGVDRRMAWLFRFIILAFCGLGSSVVVFVMTHIGGS